jgi:hypothetical protein
VVVFTTALALDFCSLRRWVCCGVRSGEI